MASNFNILNSSTLTALGFYVISVISCLIPKYLSNSKIMEKYFSLVNVFTAGLQLATIVVDLIPHMSLSKQHNHTMSEHLPFVTIGMFFLMLLSVDALYLHSKDNDKCGHTHETAKKEATQDSCHNHEDENHEHSHNNQTGTCSHSEKSESVSKGFVEKKCHSNLGTCNTAAISKSSSKTQALSMLLAISVHSFFEGFGLTIDMKHLPLIFGMLLHKILESIAVGNSISMSSFNDPSQYLLISVYSALTPFSVLIKGLPIVQKAANLQIWFHSFCLGSLMFVVFYEVIGHSFHGGKNTGKKVASIFLGYALGCTAVMMAHGGHGSGSGCSHSHHGPHKHH